MKNWYAKLTLLYKVTFVSFVAVLVAYLAMLFAYFVGNPDLPNGLLLGGGIGVVAYLALAFVEKRDKEKHRPVWTIIITILRYLFIAAAVTLSALSQFKWGYKIFNLFTLVGGYLIPLLVYIVITLMERKNV